MNWDFFHEEFKLITARGVSSIILVALIPNILIINRLDSFLLGTLSIVGIVIGLVLGIRKTIGSKSLVVGFALALFFIVPLVAYSLNPTNVLGFKILGRDLRFLLFIPATVVFYKLRVTKLELLIGWTLGLACLSIYIIVAISSNNLGRAEGVTGAPIVFGDLAACCFLIGVLLWSPKARQRAGAIYILVILLAFGLAATAVSGTRSAFVGEAGFGLFIFISSVVKARLRLSIIISGLLVIFGLGGIIVAFHPQVGNRFRNLYKSRGIAATLFDSQRSKLVASRCPNEKNLLENFSEHVGRPAWVRVNVDRIPNAISASLARSNCNAGYWITARNLSEKRAGWVWWHPELPPRSSNASITTSTLLSGCGYARIRGTRLHHKFCSERPTVATFSGEMPYPPTTVVVFRGKDAVHFIPMQDTHGGVYYRAYGLGSTYTRAEMWRSATNSFLSKPWFGGGPGWYQEYTRERIEKGLASPTIWNYEHPHNQYLFYVSTSGIFGLLTLTAALFLLIWESRSWDSEIRKIFSHLFFLICFLCFFETLFIHSMTITWITLLISLLASIFGDQKDRSRDNVNMVLRSGRPKRSGYY